ncbi:MAG: hypothetical protein R3F14_27880 [Polyangiaceae bacterium]
MTTPAPPPPAPAGAAENTPPAPSGLASEDADDTGTGTFLDVLLRSPLGAERTVAVAAALIVAVLGVLGKLAFPAERECDAFHSFEDYRDAVHDLEREATEVVTVGPRPTAGLEDEAELSELLASEPLSQRTILFIEEAPRRSLDRARGRARARLAEDYLAFVDTARLYPDKLRVCSIPSSTYRAELDRPRRTSLNALIVTGDATHLATADQRGGDSRDPRHHICRSAGDTARARWMRHQAELCTRSATEAALTAIEQEANLALIDP